MASASVIEIKGVFYPVGVQIATEYKRYGPDEHAVAMVEVRGTPTTASTQRKSRAALASVEVVYVIDRSGSMREVMPIVNAALKFLCQSTPESHSVSIVMFNEEATVYWPMTKMTPTAKQQLRSRVEPQAENYTNIAQGLHLGLSQFSENRDPNHHQFMILLSDGVATMGPDSADKILEICQGHPAFGHVHIMTLALGADVDRDLLTTLASKTHGKMYFVRTEDQLPTVLGDCLGTLLTIGVARLSVEFEAEQSLEQLRTRS